MDFVFIGLTLGCCVILGKIVIDYFNEIPVWKEKIEMADTTISECEARIEELSVEKESAAEQSKTIDDEIKKMEAMANELKGEIEKTKKEMARKGRIIMRRQPDAAGE